MDEEKKEESVPSPFVDQPKFDYETLQDNTAVKAMIEIWKAFGENAEMVAMKHDIKKEEFQENIDVMSQKVLNILIECEVCHNDMQNMVDNFYQMFNLVFKVITRQYNEYEKELLARVIGQRNPGTNKYSREYATVSGLFSALKDIREKHGDMGEDYFFIEKKEV